MKKILCFISSLFLLAVTFFSYSPLKTFAQDSGEYTSVLEDLNLDENFDQSSYKYDSTDLSLNIIQIAESTNNNLFIYTFQPSYGLYDFCATSINMSINSDDTGFSIYRLQLLSSEHGFQKYLVEDFSVLEVSERYYNIASIYRKVESCDDVESLTDEIGFKGKRFKAVGVGENVSYYIDDIEVIQVTGQYVGYIRYEDNAIWGGYDEEDKDSFFLAFSCDRPIDDLIAATVTAKIIKTETKRTVTFGINWKVKDKNIDTSTKQKTFKLNRNNKYQFSTPGVLGSEKYQWSEIQTITEFKAEKNLKLNSSVKIDDYDWVLRFFNAPHIIDSKSYVLWERKTEITYTVKEVVLIELSYKVGDNLYNLGVVGNKQSSSKGPSGTVSGIPNVRNIIKIILLILLLILILPVLSIVLKFILFLVKLIFSFVKNIIMGIVRLLKRE